MEELSVQKFLTGQNEINPPLHLNKMLQIARTSTDGQIIHFDRRSTMIQTIQGIPIYLREILQNNIILQDKGKLLINALNKKGLIRASEKLMSMQSVRCAYSL